MDFKENKVQIESEVVMDAQKIQRKVDKFTKRAVVIKDEIAKLQDDLNLIYDKMRDLGVKENEVDGFGKITEVTSTRNNINIKELAKEIGQDIIDKYTTMSTSTFYRVTTDKKFYEKN